MYIVAFQLLDGFKSFRNNNIQLSVHNTLVSHRKPGAWGPQGCQWQRQKLLNVTPGMGVICLSWECWGCF